MVIENFLDLLKGWGECRKFRPDPITEGDVEKIVEMARWSMSGANGQPWEFIVVRDAKTREKIASLWEEQLEAIHDLEKVREEEVRNREAMIPPKERPLGLKDAPAIMVIAGDPRTIQATVLVSHVVSPEYRVFHANMGNATQNVILAASSLGIGSQWIYVLPLIESRLKALLGIPEIFRIYTMVPLGYPLERPIPPSKRDPKEILHYGKYDGSRLRSNKEIWKFAAEKAPLKPTASPEGLQPMEYEELLGLAKKRRNIRRYKSDPVPDSYIEKIVEAGRLSISEGNSQPLDFIVVKDEATKGEILKALEEYDYGYFFEMTRKKEFRHPGTALPPEEHRPRFVNPPVVIVLTADPRTLLAVPLAWSLLSYEYQIFHINFSNAVQNMHLAAATYGLGAHWVSITPPIDTSIKPILGIPPVFRIYTVIPVGYPAYEPVPSYRRDLKEILHLERYDSSKYKSDEGVRSYIARLRRVTTPTYKV